MRELRPKPRGREDDGNGPLWFASKPVRGLIGLRLPIVKIGAAATLPNTLSINPEDFLPSSSSPNGRSNLPLNPNRCLWSLADNTMSHLDIAHYFVGKLAERRTSKQSGICTSTSPATCRQLWRQSKVPGPTPLPFHLTSGIIRVCLDLTGLFRN